jgi:hypothetical protein
MKKAIFASALASLLIAGSAFAAAGYTFSNYLRVGSTGADVVALQSFLVDGGFLTMPAGVSMGYFGGLTKAAVVKYQASVSLPATGFVGPLTVAKLNGTTIVTLPPAACPAGYTCTPVGGTVPPGTTTGGITTPGVEGTLTVTSSNAGLPSTLYEGDTMVGVLGLKVEAKTSDIAIQRVKIDLGTSSKVYNKIFRKIYLTEGSTVLASADLNSSTVVKESDNKYTITLAGFSTVVARNSSKILTVKMDLYSSIDSTDLSGSYPIALYGTTGAVRGVDGAGIDQYSGTNSITRTPSLSGSLVDLATLKLSKNPDSPLASDLIASSGAEKDEADKVTTLIFDLKAEKDAVLVTDIIATTTGTAVTDGSIATAYLFDGSTELDSASVNSSGAAVFNDVDISIAKDQRKTLTIKVDVRSASTTALSATSNITAAGITAENSAGDTLTVGTALTGSATGEALTIKKTGISITLVSKSTSKTTTTNTNAATSTSILDGIFTLRVTASGADVVIGQTGSTTGAFAKTSAASSSDSFTVYKNSVDQATTTFSAVEVVDYAVPTGVTTDNTNASFTIADGNSADIEVHAKITVTGAAAPNTYAIQLKKLYINGSTTVTFMDGQTAWRTSGVTLP